MKKIQQIGLVILLLAAASIVTFAGDYAHFHFIGFSHDGRYLAFEEYGINDDLEDSSPYSAIYIVNVDKNTFAVSPFKANGNISPYDENGQYDSDKIETEVRERNKRRAAKQLKRFGIVEGNTGLQVAAHLINEYEPTYSDSHGIGQPDPDLRENNDVGAPDPDSNSNTNANKSIPAPNSNVNTYPLPEPKHDPMDDYQVFLPQHVAFTKRGNALYRDGYYELNIRPVSVTQKNCDEYERDMFSFELALRNEQGKARVLQAAGKVPKNRGCVDGYGIQEVYVYKNRLAVFMGIFTRGWEGENMRMMAVTGELDGD